MTGHRELPLSICVILVNAAMAEDREALGPPPEQGAPAPGQRRRDRDIKT